MEISKSFPQGNADYMTTQPNPVHHENGPFFDLEMFEMLCSRICHDLISPVSAVNNGVELLRESLVNLDKDVVELIGASAASAQARLQVFRAAFGRGGELTSDGGLENVKRLINEYFPLQNINVEWRHDERSTVKNIPKNTLKLILNFTLIAAEALPVGGGLTIESAISKPGWLTLEIHAQGRKCGLPGNVETALKNGSSINSYDPHSVHAILIARLSVYIGAKIDIGENNASEENLSMRLHIPVENHSDDPSSL